MVFPTRFVKEQYKILLIFLVSLIYGLQVLRLSDGFMINRYPFISDDGYDWITEGYFLYSYVVGGHPNLTLPVARPPFFVLITMVDSFFGGAGYVVALIMFITIFGLLYTSLKCLGEYNNNKFVVFSLVIILALSPINYVRFWILSEPIAVFLSFIAFVCVFKIMDEHTSNKITVGTISLIVLSGLTQTYALAAPMITTFIFLVDGGINKNYLVVKKALWIIITSTLFFFLVKKVWFAFIPHTMTPDTFVLLRFSMNMLEFYIHTWGYLFFPLAPLLILIIINREKKKIFKDKMTLSLWLVVIIFMVLSFFYQWPSSRFTFIFWPFLVLALLRTLMLLESSYKNHVILFAVVAVLIQSIFIKVDEWHPKLNNLSFGGGYLPKYLLAKPVDQLMLLEQCGNDQLLCNNMKIPERFSPYSSGTLTVFKSLFLKIHPDNTPLPFFTSSKEAIFSSTPIIQYDLFYIETINKLGDKNRVFTIKQSEQEISIAGWAINKGDQSAPEKIVIELKNKNTNEHYYLENMHRYSRPDVAAALKNNNLEMSGFSGFADKSNIPIGEYDIYVHQIDEKNHVKCISDYSLIITK